jgi:hypothetical protein
MRMNSACKFKIYQVFSGIHVRFRFYQVFIGIHVNEIFHEITKLDANKSSGTDNIRPRYLK